MSEHRTNRVLVILADGFEEIEGYSLNRVGNPT